ATSGPHSREHGTPAGDSAGQRQPFQGLNIVRSAHRKAARAPQSTDAVRRDHRAGHTLPAANPCARVIVMAEELVHYRADRGVATVTLAPPHNRHALSARFRREFPEAPTTA